MTTEELKIKVGLDTSRLKKQIGELKQAFKDVKLDSKNKQNSDELNRSLEKVESTLKDIDRLNFGDGIADGLDRAKKKAKELNNAVSGISSNTSTKVGVSDSGLSEANEQLTALQDTMGSIAGLEFGQLLIEALKDGPVARSIEKIKKSFEGFKNSVDLAKEGVANLDNVVQAAIPWQTKYKKENDIGQGLGDSFRHLKTSASMMTSSFKNLGGIIAGVAGAIAELAATAAALVAALYPVIGVINALTRAKDIANQAFSAEKIGMTSNALGGLSFMITQTGGEVDDLTDFIRTLTDVQNQLRDGTEDMIAVYKRLGISAEEASKMSQHEMFVKTIKGLQGVRDEVERTALAYKIFGEDDAAKVTTLLNLSSTEMAILMNNYRVLGGYMSEGLIENSKRLTQMLGNLRIAWTGLRNTLAEVFLPIIIPVVQWLTKAVAVVNMFIRALFGKEIVATGNSIKDVSSAYTGYTDSADQATNSTNRVTEAIERLKRVTMGFDELNKLPGVDRIPGSSSGTDGGTGDSGVSQLPTGGGVGGLDIPTVDDLGLNGIAEWFETNQSKLQFWGSLLLTLGGIALAVFCFLHGNILGGIAGLTLAGIGIHAGVQEGGVWDRVFDTIKGVWEDFKSWFSGFMNGIKSGWGSFIDWLGTTVSNIWDVITGFLQGIGQGIADLFTLGSDLWDWLGDLLSSAGQGIVNAFKQAWEDIKRLGGWFIGLFVDEAYASDGSSKKAGKNFMNSFSEGVAEAWEGFKKSAAGQFFAGIGNNIIELKAKFVETGSNIRQTLVNAWDKLKDKTATLTSKFTDGWYANRQRLTAAWDKLKSKTAELKTKFTDGWSVTRQRLAGAWDKIKTKTATLTGSFKRTGYYQTLSNYWDKFKTKTSTLTVAFKDAFTSKIKAAWNGLVKAINKAITTINKIPGVNIPKLPQLATGGIVTGPTTALIGEAGREAVLPLDRNTGWMDALADKIAAKGGNNNAPSKIVLTVDGKQLGWATIDNINSITKQTGVLPLQLV